MSVKETSLTALVDLIESGGQMKQQEKVLAAFLNHRLPVLTRQEIAQASALPINAVCGRVNELITSEYISVGGVKTCSITKKVVEGLILTSKLK
jgi:predicted transcriptional regulator